jgi:hypothetical protein
MTDSSQSNPLNRARMAAEARHATVAAQAASRRRESPKASRMSTIPRTLERKWLISMRMIGAWRASHIKRSGSDGVAPEASSITPAAAVRRASHPGAPPNMHRRKARNQPISLLRGVWIADTSPAECSAGGL